MTSSYPAVNSLRYLRHHISAVFSSLVVKISKQLPSELRKGLSEAGVWDLFDIIRPSAPDDSHGRILCSKPMIVRPRSRYHLQHRYRPPGVPLSFLKKRSLTHAFSSPPGGNVRDTGGLALNSDFFLHNTLREVKSKSLTASRGISKHKEAC